MTTSNSIDNIETLSGLIDNQVDDLDVEQHLQALDSDPDLRGKWARYHLIRDVMQKEYSPTSSDFASRVSLAIQDEPAIVAFPSHATAAQDATQPGSAGSSKAVGKPVTQIGWRRGATGFAVAASVAMVSLVGLNMFKADDEIGGGGSIQTATNGVVPPQTSIPVELVSNTGTYWVSTGQNQLSTINEQRLNMLLSQHIENSPTSSVQGMLPYSRLAGYDAVRDQQE